MKKWIFIIVPVLLFILCVVFGTLNSINTEKKLTNAFIAQFCFDSETPPEKLEVKSYGTYDGCTVADINVSRYVHGFNWPENEKVGAYNFNYSSVNTLMAYKDGVFISLSEAYKNGWLDNKDVEKVLKVHKQEYGNLYWSCIGSVEKPADPVGTTARPQPTTTVPVPTTTEPVPTTTAPTPPTEPINAELEYFNELFRRGQVRNPYAYVLGIEFASPKELDLYYFYDQGLPGEHQITDAEWEELSKLLPFPEYVVGDFNRLPKDKMEAELQAVFGISLEDMSDSAFSRLYYLNTSDSYCFYQSGVSSYNKIGSFVELNHNEDGTVSLTYISGNGNLDVFVITLMPFGDSYQILSNVKLG